jgi:ATP-dependent DNA helicase RecQ
MGVHKDNVRQIIHDHFPSSVANYAQEVGRAGRDGLDSLATLFFTRDDEDHSIFVATNDFPDESHVRVYKEFQQNGQHPGQLVEMGLLSETHVRILTYWLPRKSDEETINIFHQLKRQKINHIILMKEILSNNSCIRHQIIEVFGQKLNERPDNCCSKCGLIKEDVVKQSKKQKNQRIIQTWEKRISALFQRND